MDPMNVNASLAGLLSEDDLADRGYDIVKAWQDAGTGPEAMGPVLQFMETHADWDLGSPGPLVHFVERFLGRGYEEELLASVARKPTAHTLWMLNRLINGEQDADRKALLLNALSASKSSPDVTPDVAEIARQFEAFQAGGQ